MAMYEKDPVLPLTRMYGKNLIFKTGGVDAADCRELLELLREGKLTTDFLITHRRAAVSDFRGIRIPLNTRRTDVLSG